MKARKGKRIFIVYTEGEKWSHYTGKAEFRGNCPHSVNADYDGHHHIYARLPDGQDCIFPESCVVSK